MGTLAQAQNKRRTTAQPHKSDVHQTRGKPVLQPATRRQPCGHERLPRASSRVLPCQLLTCTALQPLVHPRACSACAAAGAPTASASAAAGSGGALHPSRFFRGGSGGGSSGGSSGGRRPLGSCAQGSRPRPHDCQASASAHRGRLRAGHRAFALWHANSPWARMDDEHAARAVRAERPVPGLLGASEQRGRQ